MAGVETEKLVSFIQEHYAQELAKALHDNTALVIDFGDFDRVDPITADVLLEDPVTVFKAFDDAVRQLTDEKINVRFKNLPESRNIRIRNLRAKHLAKLWTIDAVIKSVSEVKPQISEATFECPDCSARIVVPQEGNLVKRPGVCTGCGRRGDFTLVSKKMFDMRYLNGVEPFEITTGEQPGTVAIFLKEDLTTPRMQRKTDPGARLRIVGVLKELPKTIKGRLSTKMDMFVEANYIETSDIDLDDMTLTTEDEEHILELARDPEVYEKLKMSIAPEIYGHDEIKESVVLQLFGGVQHTMPDGSKIRGNIHILLTGDPGIGKSVIGSSRILHNSDENPEYTTIEKLIDHALAKEKILHPSGAEISLKNDENIRVLALNPQTMNVTWQPVSAFIRHESPEYLVKIKTKSGREVVATEDHSFVIMNEDGDLVNIQGIGIKEGMFVPVSLNTHKQMKDSVEFNQIIHTNTKSLPSAIKLDWHFGFFLGMFLSEGSLSKGSVYVDSKNMERKIKMKEFLDTFGLKSKIDDNRIICSSRNFVSFLENSCYEGEKVGKGKGSGAIRKRIPNFCFYAPKDFIYGILSGLFSGDGYYTNAKPLHGRTKGNLKVGFATISEHLAHGLLDMLSLVGIFSLIRKKTYFYKNRQGRAYEITVSGRHAKNILDKIQMIGKKRTIQRFSEKDSFDLIPSTKLIYDIVTILGYSKRLAENAKKRRTFAAMMRTVLKRKKIGRGRTEKVYTILLEEAQIQKNSKAVEKLEKLRNILDGNIVWDCVENVEKIKSTEKYVYDLSINGCETFVVNNLVVHNTQIMKLVTSIVPRGKYVSGTGTSAAGMTASVRKDEILGGWVLEAGALILANKSVIGIDEFDKIGKEDLVAMHEAMSVETVSIAKASIVATLPAQTAVLAAANPKYGRFDPYQPVASQIQIPETLLSRFDLKFALRDVPDKDRDERLAEHVLVSRLHKEQMIPIIDHHLLRKYIAYAKRKNDVQLTEDAARTLKKFYIEMRNSHKGDDVPTIAITLRQYEALIRLAEASAKIRLDTKVSMSDADRAIRLMKFSLYQLGYDYETGKIDVDRLESSVTASKRRRIAIVIDIIEGLQKNNKEVSLEDVKAEAESQGIEHVDEIIERLKNEGTVFEPKAGFIRKV